MQEEKGNKDIGIHKSPPIDMKITEARKESHKE
jgi:hypothetical protein